VGGLVPPWLLLLVLGVAALAGRVAAGAATVTGVSAMSARGLMLSAC
jgi:hypothetical protein